MSVVPGELAALLTSLCFSLSSTFFSIATRRFGAMVVNRTRLALAALFLMATHALLYGLALPVNAAPQRWFWLGLSGIVGLVLGDIFLFNAYAHIGARLTMLMMSLAPVVAALTAWLFLGEKLAWREWLGVAVTVGGIAWVVLERNGQANSLKDPRYGRGILLGLGAAVGQALGMVLAKPGLAGDFPAISGNAIRMITAATAMWLLTLAQHQGRNTLQTLATRPRSLAFILGGMIFGPFVGVSLSLYAVQHTNVGVASTLTALPPIFMLPIGYFVFRERFGWGAVAGTLLAIAGVALLFLS